MNNKRTKNWFGLVRRLRFPNRKYKDRLFRRVFKDKKYLLELYNAINGTNYDNPDDLEITTMEDVIFMSMKNDVSFMISSTMNLYEHQSTVNPNMPIRGMLYLTQLYDEFIKMHGLNVYGRKLVKVPMPQYIVFYNGKDKVPDDQTLLLSDAFECDALAKDMEPALECRARVLNVNDGHNLELMNKCKRLMHYSQFITKINQNIEAGMPLNHAIDEAIDYCLERDMLTDVLLKNRSEVSHMLLTEFDEKKFAKSMWADGYESGSNTIFSIMEEINEGNDTVEKLTALGYDEELAKKVLERK